MGENDMPVVVTRLQTAIQPPLPVALCIYYLFHCVLHSCRKWWMYCILSAYYAKTCWI